MVDEREAPGRKAGFRRRPSHQVQQEALQQRPRAVYPSGAKPGGVTFGKCKNRECAGGGSFLTFDTKCQACNTFIRVGTLCLSLKVEDKSEYCCRIFLLNRAAAFFGFFCRTEQLPSSYNSSAYICPRHALHAQPYTTQAPVLARCCVM